MPAAIYYVRVELPPMVRYDSSNMIGQRTAEETIASEISKHSCREKPKEHKILCMFEEEE